MLDSGVISTQQSFDNTLTQSEVGRSSRTETVTDFRPILKLGPEVLPDQHDIESELNNSKFSEKKAEQRNKR